VNILFTVLFIAAALVHFFSIFMHRPKLQKRSKVCLVPLLLLVYITGARTILVSVILAAVFGWGGDVFLLKIKDNKFFKLGLASFLIGHLCYIPSILFFAKSFSIPGIVIYILLMGPGGFLIIKRIKPPGDMKIPAVIYEIVIALMSLSALQLFLDRLDIPSAFVFGGSICFLVSDMILAIYTFSSLPKYGSFHIMLPYVSAQLCIILGLAAC
jgi:uncharacterized membrane protein YhhN